MTTPLDFRTLLSDDSYAATFQSLGQYRSALLKALPEPMTTSPLAPIPVSDTDGMAEQCLEMIRERLIKLKIIGDHTPPMMYGEAIANAVAKAAPIPASKRLPGAEDCDAEGRCWCYQHCPEPNAFAKELRLARVLSWHTHWLPHWAIPLPEES